MPRARVHRRVGAVTGAGVTLLASHNLPPDARLAVTIAGGLGGYVGGLAPDIAEPAIHGWHRSFFHSATAGAGVVRGIIWGKASTDELLQHAAELRARRSELPPEDPERSMLWLKEFGLYMLCGIVVGFAAGYLSHLVLDAGTKRSIPLLGH